MLWTKGCVPLNSLSLRFKNSTGLVLRQPRASSSGLSHVPTLWLWTSDSSSEPVSPSTERWACCHRVVMRIKLREISACGPTGPPDPPLLSPPKGPGQTEGVSPLGNHRFSEASRMENPEKKRRPRPAVPGVTLVDVTLGTGPAQSGPSMLCLAPSARSTSNMHPSPKTPPGGSRRRARPPLPPPLLQMMTSTSGSSGRVGRAGTRPWVLSPSREH